MIVEEMTTAYQTINTKSSIWGNKVFLFEADKLAEEFFNFPMLVLKTLGIKLEEDEDLDSIQYKKLRTQRKTFYGVTFTCKNRGDVIIRMVNNGFLIERDNQNE